MLGRSDLGEEVRPWLPVESSRGCWWGERRPCAFCALDGPVRRARSKSPARVLTELEVLAARHLGRRFQFTDTLLPRTLLPDLLPDLARRNPPLQLLWEVRPDLGGEQLDLLWRAGARVLQPGVESLSSHLLKCLGKGTSGPRNLAFLRDCGSRGISARWNLLVRVPGEHREDYEALKRLFPQVEHLQPPEGWGPVRIDRFSCYHARPEAYGLANLRPLPAYGDLYPPGAPVADLAAHFEADGPTALERDPELGQAFASALGLWVAAWRPPSLRPRLEAVDLGSGLVLVRDSRRLAVEANCVLVPAAARLLARLDRPLRVGRLSEQDQSTLEELLGRLFVVEHDGFLVSLVTRPIHGVTLRRDQGGASSG